ncbi:MAG: UPF0175 family protein [Euryarchaeota archaeon]|nr:UPF0175 family protein [Euryarchaeota archaeon]
MPQTVVTVRIDQKLLRWLDEIAKALKIDRASIVRILLNEGVQKHKLELALKLLKEGKITTEKAAEMCELSIYEIIEAARKEGIPSQLTIEDIRKETATMLKRLKKVELAKKIS